MTETRSAFSVEEFHGPYGPYQVSELVLQKIWLERAFDTSRLRDQWGRSVEVVDPGIWNRLDGPDFKGATLRIDGDVRRGDVEVHFSEADWNSHAHAKDPSFDEVILHVLLHEPRGFAQSARRSDGVELPRVSLLPLLWYSLEEYAGDDSLIASTGVDLRPEVEALLELSLDQRRERLVQLAAKRWSMKRYFASQRVERLGWNGACHQSCLEALGYARNRIPMLMVAERLSLEAFSESSLELDAVLACGEDRWRFSGCRPANHPRRRLQQYKGIVLRSPDWPRRMWDEGLGKCTKNFAVDASDWGTFAARKRLGVAAFRDWIRNELLGRAILGPKADTLICDVIIPLLAARGGGDLFSLWFHSYPGNAPAGCFEALRLLQVLKAREVPLSNGWLQGILGARLGWERNEALV